MVGLKSGNEIFRAWKEDLLNHEKKLLEKEKGLCISLAKKERSKVLMELDSLYHNLELGLNGPYTEVLEFMKERNFSHIVDIGCAHGFQSKLFQLAEIEYDGVDAYANSMNMYLNNSEDVRYHQFIYGEEEANTIRVKEKTLAVAVLSLGWNCYLYEGQETLKRQADALSNQFEHALLYVQKDYVSEFKKVYAYSEDVKSHEIGKFIYLSNKK